MLSIYSKRSRLFALVLGVFTSSFVLFVGLESSSYAQSSPDFTPVCRARTLTNQDINRIEDGGGLVSDSPQFAANNGRPIAWQCYLPAQTYPDLGEPNGNWQVLPQVSTQNSSQPTEFDGNIRFSPESNALMFASIKFFAINFVLWLISRIF